MATTIATLNNSIYDFILSVVVGKAVQTPRMYNYWVHVKDIRNAATNKWRSTVRGQIPDAVVMPELAEFEDAPMSAVPVDIAVDTIGRSVLVSWELGISSPFAETMMAGQQVVDSCRNKIEDLLWSDVAPTITESSGDSGTPMTFTQHISFGMEAAAQWKDNPPAGSVMRCAMHSGPFRHLVTNMADSQASVFAATFGGSQLAQVLASANNGGMKTIAGVQTFVTDRIPVADTTGRGNVYGLVGGETGSLFGLAVKSEIKGELRGLEKSLGSRAVAYARIGLGKLRDEFGMVGVTAAN